MTAKIKNRIHDPEHNRMYYHNFDETKTLYCLVIGADFTNRLAISLST